MNPALRRSLLAPGVLATLALGFARPAAAELPRVTVTVDSTRASTRLVLTHSRPVSWVIQSSRQKLRVLYAEPVEVEPAQLELDEGVLEGYRLEGQRTLVLRAGPDYARYESFELRNPPRLILDLKAESSTDGRRERGRAKPREEQRETIIVIDPGHGGIENGAVGPSGVLEKDVTLALARRLEQALQEVDPAISVVLTRDDDSHLALDERTAIANHNRADLFLSIHVNASPRRDASGAETYYLSTDATDDEARILAQLENRSIDPARPDAAAAVPADTLDLVLWDLAQKQHLAQSSALAEAVQRHLNELTGTRDRGVRQAPFTVLAGATMPAILVEVAFISNPDEEALLETPDYRERVVGALVAALREFLFNLERLAVPVSADGRPGGGP